MTAHETVPATSPRQADDAFLASCNALLVALATDSMIEDAEADVLCGAMPDASLRDGLRVAFGQHGLHQASVWGLGR